MGQRRPDQASQLQSRRRRIAAGAARLIAGLGVQDYREAKRRAARELGFGDDDASLPADALVREEVIAYLRLFRGDEQARALGLRREAALEAMEFFQPFEPRLVGRVLDGSADAGSPVQLQVFSDDADEVARFLLDADMPTRTLANRRLRLPDGTARDFSAWVFQAQGLDFEVVVLPTTLLRQAPLGEDGKPMHRANAKALRALLDQPPP